MYESHSGCRVTCHHSGCRVTCHHSGCRVTCHHSGCRVTCHHSGCTVTCHHSFSSSHISGDAVDHSHLCNSVIGLPSHSFKTDVFQTLSTSCFTALNDLISHYKYLSYNFRTKYEPFQNINTLHITYVGNMRNL